MATQLFPGLLEIADTYFVDNLVANAMPPTPPTVHCVLCGRCTVENSHEHERNARHFLTQLSHLLCTVQPVHNNKQPFTETELSPFLRCAFLARWVLRRRFASKNVICMDETLAIFLCDPFGVLLRFHPTCKSQDVLR